MLRWRIQCSKVMPAGVNYENDNRECSDHDLLENTKGFNIYDGEDHSDTPSWLGNGTNWIFVGVKSQW